MDLILWMLLLLASSGQVLCDMRDPYLTLGLSRTASIKEIKLKYKSLVKEWHPDKNDSPKAHEKFMEVQQAYEVLSDPLKKEQYDKFGSVNDGPNDANSFYKFHETFGSPFFSTNTFFSKHRITMRIFMHTLQEESFSQPILIFVYSGWCSLCFRLEPIWKSVVEDLEPLGYAIGTVNAMTDANLLERIRVGRVPSILAFVEGRAIHYRDSLSSLTAKSLRLFARDVLPSSFLTRVKDHSGLKRFIDQWESTNKISVLVVSSKAEPRMRYMLAAMKFANFARFAYVYLDVTSGTIRKMRDALEIVCHDCESVFIFNDFPEKGPIARITALNGKQISMESLSTFIENNLHLVLPRLASQAHLDELCPISPRGFRRLCVILAADTSDHKYVSLLRNFVSKQTSAENGEKIRYTYIFLNRQREFIEPFKKILQKRGVNTEINGSKRDVIVLWRIEYDRARFIWLREVWDSNESSLSESFAKLKQKMDEIAIGATKLELQTNLAKIHDEYSPSWFTRLSRSAVRLGQTAWFHLTKEEALPVLSAVGTFLVILLFGYGLSFTNRGEERRKMNRKEKYPRSSEKKNDDHWSSGNGLERTMSNRSASLRQQRLVREMEPLIHELRAETYFGLVKLLKPGCRSIVVLVDEKSKDVLLPQFARHVWPFRNNKTFSFGYLMVEKNLPWFRKLLEFIMPRSDSQDLSEESQKTNGSISSKSSRLKNINPSQTIGTVLVLCGWKLYFNIYHPMFSSPTKKNFLGFDDDGEPVSSEDSDDQDVSEEVHIRRSYKPKAEDVLNGLPNWLDRLFEGSINRFYIPEWPDNLR
uniref:DnaJ homolog subfamily C member 16 n=1 Tax=Syphacia muris TaxID=451379 RepID=A0A0N5AG39_9BILA